MSTECLQICLFILGYFYFLQDNTLKQERRSETQQENTICQLMLHRLFYLFI